MNQPAALSSLDLVSLKQFEAIYDPARHLLKTPDGKQWAIAQRTLDYTLLLLRRNEQGDHDRAFDIITAVLDTQLQTPDWEHGRFPFLTPETWRDLNANLFMTPALVELHTRWRHALPASLASRLEIAIHAAVNIVERRWADERFDPHRDFTAYSNIFVLYIRALYMLGQALDIPRLTHDALYQWQRWFNRVSVHGVEEFTSPTYTRVIYEALLDIHAMVTNEDGVQKEVALVLDHLFTLQHAVNHPLLRVPAVGSSRDYRQFVPAGKGAFEFLEHEGSHGYQPPAEVVREFKQRCFPYRASGRAGSTPFLFQSWQDTHAAMGSMTGGNYFPQQIHLMAAVGQSPDDRACAFFNALPNNPIQGYVRQHDHRALCLYARTPTPYSRYQLRQSPGPLPHEGTFPPCLGLTRDWVSRSDQPGVLTATAYGYTLHMQAFSLHDNTLAPMALTQQKIEAGHDMSVTGWSGDSNCVWSVFLVELLPEKTRPTPVTLQGKITASEVTLAETGGLELKIFRRPQGRQGDTGELVELYNQDWRTLPLLTTPQHTLHAGGLIAASVDDPQR